MNGRTSTPAEVFDLVRTIYVPDDKIGQDFALFEIDTKRRRKLAKYILAKLEEDAASRSCDPSTDPGTIEHILPKNPHKSCMRPIRENIGRVEFTVSAT